jgi:ADP-heptose:LPS heptosyltransferase
VGLNPGAGRRWPAKQLSVPASARLADALARATRRPILLLGGPDEAARNRRIARLSHGRVIDAGTGHDLRSFAGVLDLCAAAVTTDSLAFHVAAALGKPVVCLVGPTSTAELDAFGRGTLMCPPGGCSCFYRSRCLRRVSCLDALDPDSVAGTLRRALARR